jgi:glycosyltransferase involved in cell wall biosynthesis
MNHGGSLRYFNLSKELIGKGHEVYFVIIKSEPAESALKRQYLEALQEQGMVTGYYEIEKDQYPRLRGKAGSLISYPGAANRLLRKYQSPAVSRLREIISERQINLAIFNDRNQLFLLPSLPREIKVVIDWVDSSVLFFEREIKLSWGARKLNGVPRAMRCLVDALAQEHYYSKLSDINLLVSPVDKKCLDSLNGTPQKNRVLLNGLRIEMGSNGTGKISNRIIFSGNMDFEPNYMGALWFIDHVLPLLLKERGDLKLVIAGANPVPELLARADEHVEVTGYVEDMGREIAMSAVYVAPLVSGGGFKNKVVEAIAHGTFVIATPMAVEFLDTSLQQYLLIADTPEDIARHVLSYLDDPGRFDERLKTLQKVISTEFTWEKRSDELIDIARQLFSEV